MVVFSLPRRVVLGALLPGVLPLASSACAHKKAAVEHSAHGHAIAMVERPDGDSMMLERVEDEDTHWVEIPNFGECPYAEGNVPPFTPVDDSHVPGLDPERSRLTNMDSGEKTIHNEALLGHLDHATVEVLECISVSNCYDERPLEPGWIDLRFELAPTGKVRGVDVEPSAGLDHKGIRACSRVAIWDTKFPAFDGADMVVTYKLDID